MLLPTHKFATLHPEAKRHVPQDVAEPEHFSDLSGSNGFFR